MFCHFALAAVSALWAGCFAWSGRSIECGSKCVGCQLVQQKRGLAFGIMEAGFGAGQMLLVPGSLMLIHWFSWKLTVVVLGLLLIVIVFPAALLMLRNNPSEKNAEPIGGLAATEKKQRPNQLLFQ